MRRSALISLSLIVVLAVLGFVGLNRQASAEPTTLKAPRAVVWRDFLGVNAHFLWFSQPAYERQIDRLQALGLDYVRVDLHWDRLEPQEGQYDLNALNVLVETLRARQLRSVFYLVGSAPFITSAPADSPYPDQYPPRDPGVYAQRIALLAQNYPSVTAWQIWNEPNLPSFWRPAEDPDAYAGILSPAVQALRQSAPNATPVMAGMAYYSQMPTLGGLMLEALAKLGALQLGAVVAYHPYSQYPEGDDPAAQDFVLRARQVNQSLRSQQVAGIWATEWGWSSYSGPKEEQNIIGADGQADYLLRRVALMSALDYDRIFLFALSDLDTRASARDQHYGLLDLNGEPKLAYLALQRFLQISGPRLEPADPPRIQGAPADLYTIAWTRSDGKNLLMFWSASGGSFKLQQVASATLYNPLDGGSQPLNKSGGVTVLTRPSLQMLVW